MESPISESRANTPLRHMVDLLYEANVPYELSDIIKQHNTGSLISPATLRSRIKPIIVFYEIYEVKKKGQNATIPGLKQTA